MTDELFLSQAQSLKHKPTRIDTPHIAMTPSSKGRREMQRRRDLLAVNCAASGRCDGNGLATIATGARWMSWPTP